jgi:3-methyl-2-oxobutanoate hydroxymethyltransferase
LGAIRKIVDAGIPVMGHLGLTPQSVNQLGGFRAQGKTVVAAKKIYEDAVMLQDAGCFSLVLEAIPAQLAIYITQKLVIPTVGIGAGIGCDGQVLVTHDLIGLFDRFTPRFVKQYTQVYQEMMRAFLAFKSDVADQAFPENEHSTFMSEEIWGNFLKEVDR